MNILQQVSHILSELLSINGSQILLGSKIRADLGADSFDDIELIMEMEEKFDVEIGDSEIDLAAATVRELCDLVASKLREKGMEVETPWKDESLVPVVFPHEEDPFRQQVVEAISRYSGVPLCEISASSLLEEIDRRIQGSKDPLHWVIGDEFGFDLDRCLKGRLKTVDGLCRCIAYLKRAPHGAVVVHQDSGDFILQRDQAKPLLQQIIDFISTENGIPISEIRRDTEIRHLESFTDYSSESLPWHVANYFGFDFDRWSDQCKIKTIGDLVVCIEYIMRHSDSNGAVSKVGAPNDPQPKTSIGKYNDVDPRAKLKPGEPWFFLRAQDIHAPAVVRSYASGLASSGDSKGSREVYALADLMSEWQTANPDKVKRPD